MSDEVKITCEICDDLLPLVEDGIASEESRQAVFSHICKCEKCRRNYPGFFRTVTTPQAQTNNSTGTGADITQDTGRHGIGSLPEKDDSRILLRIREKLSLWLLLCIGVSLLLGVLIVLLSSSSSPYLMLLIFPAICGAVYWFGGRTWIWVPPAAALLWIIISLLLYAGNASNWGAAILDTVLSAVLPFLLSCVGALAAALLKYAFKGEF